MNRRPGRWPPPDMDRADSLRREQPSAAITVDLHEGDTARDIDRAAEWLTSVGVQATFFVPSLMFRQERFRSTLARLPQLGHEIGSHTHRHDWDEMSALASGQRSRLSFLRTSKDLFEAFYGCAPTSFRSACWCYVGTAARDELVALGYRVDSSATPQRPAVLGSMPFAAGWLTSSRRVHALRQGLLEVPTSSWLVPAGAPTFQMLRSRLSLWFVRLMIGEARVLPGRVVVVQFHAGDFDPAAAPPGPPRGITAGDFLPHPQGGFGFRHHLRTRSGATVSATTQAIVRLLTQLPCVTVTAAAETAAAGSAGLRDRRSASAGGG